LRRRDWPVLTRPRLAAFDLSTEDAGWLDRPNSPPHPSDALPSELTSASSATPAPAGCHAPPPRRARRTAVATANSSSPRPTSHTPPRPTRTTAPAPPPPPSPISSIRPAVTRAISRSPAWMMSRPPGYDELSDDELDAVITSAIDEREDQFRAEYDADGRPFLGRRSVLEQSRYGCPQTREPRFGISPKVACRNRWRRIERLAFNKAWLVAYRAALTAWRAGDRAVVFPAGTYQMRVLHGVTCADPPI